MGPELVSICPFEGFGRPGKGWGHGCFGVGGVFLCIWSSLYEVFKTGMLLKRHDKIEWWLNMDEVIEDNLGMILEMMRKLMEMKYEDFAETGKKEEGEVP